MISIYRARAINSSVNTHAPSVDQKSTSTYNLCMTVSKEQFLEKFGRKIKVARGKTGLSQEALADKAHLHRTYMGRIERGESNPPIYTVNKIATALKLRLDQLFAN